jgi:hypothetical protein
MGCGVSSLPAGRYEDTSALPAPIEADDAHPAIAGAMVLVARDRDQADKQNGRTVVPSTGNAEGRRNLGQTRAVEGTAAQIVPLHMDAAQPQSKVSRPLAGAGTAQDLVSGGLLVLSKLAEACPFPGAAAVGAVLNQCYLIFNAAVSKTIWMAEFAVYLRSIELDLSGAQAAFQRQDYLHRLAEKLEGTRSLVSTIASRSRYVSILCAPGDEEALSREKDAIELIKQSALTSMMNEVKGDTAATRLGIEALRREQAEAFASQEKRERERLERAETERVVARLRPVDFTSELDRELARYMPGTRLSLLQAAGAWFRSDPNQRHQSSLPAMSRMFWLKGAAGTGKTCLSAKLCELHAHQILAIHFCRHDIKERRDAARMVQSLSFQLAQRIPQYRERLIKVLSTVFGTDGAEAPSAKELWNSLIAQPLKDIDLPLFPQASTSDVSAPPRRYAILIDALDEAGSESGNELLDSLATSLDALPTWLGVVLTSRPDANIVAKLMKYRPVDIVCER